MTNKTVNIINSHKIYSGDISIKIDKFKLNGKKTIIKEIVEHAPSVGIIPVKNHSRDILFVSQYRHGARKTTLEIPAGKIEKYESPRQAAVREMAEEIGYSGKLSFLLKLYLAPGYNTEFIHIFVATHLKKLKKDTKPNLDDDEDNIKTKSIKLNKAVKKCIKGEIEDCKTVAAILAYSKLLEVNGKVFDFNKR